jgi:hypothetical protein
MRCGFGNVIRAESLISTLVFNVVDDLDLPIWIASADAADVPVRHVRTDVSGSIPDVIEMRMRLASISLRDVNVPANVDDNKGLRTPNGVDALVSIARQPEMRKPAGIT